LTLGVNKVLNDTKQLLVQLQQLEAAFESSAIDNENWFNRSDVFVSSAFYTKSNELSDYFQELKGNIAKLERLNEQAYLEFLADKVTQQFSCLRSLLNSASVHSKDKTYRFRQKSKVQQAKQFTKRISQSSQDLYTELSKLQEFERRLLEMVAERQQKLHQYTGSVKRQEYQQDVLTYHQRLGRCRQALSKVEEQIQKLDEKN
jgi:primosomal replication protein N''